MHNGLAINRPHRNGAVSFKVQNHKRIEQREKRAREVGYIALLCVGEKGVLAFLLCDAWHNAEAYHESNWHERYDVDRQVQWVRA